MPNITWIWLDKCWIVPPWPRYFLLAFDRLFTHVSESIEWTQPLTIGRSVWWTMQHLEVWWCDVSWSEVWQMLASRDAVTLIMGYFLACWANLIIIPPGHGIKRREKHPFIRSYFPIPVTNTLGEMILQTKYFSLSPGQSPSSSLNWSPWTHFLWTSAKVYTNQSIRSNEIRPSLSWFWSLFSPLIIPVM